VVVGEYSGHYERGTDYLVSFPSIITILHYDEGYSYDFDCFDDSTDEPHTPATIQAITAVDGVGDIEVNIFEHDSRAAGAQDVLVFFPQANVASVTIGRLHIFGRLGTPLSQPSYLDRVKWYFNAGSLGKELHVKWLEGG
jgi:hypothetical protein